VSIKLSELVIKPKEGKLCIGKVNKRGHFTDCRDISSPIVRAVIKIITTKRDETYIHQKITNDDGTESHYKITCYEMTPEEVKQMKRDDEIRAVSAKKSISSLMGLMLNSFGCNNIRL